MGQDGSRPAAEPTTAPAAGGAKLDALVKFQAESGFAASQVEELYKHFTRIAKLRDDDGVVSRAEFFQVLQCKESLLLDRMFDLFDRDRSGTIDFREFLVGLAILCDRADRATKLAFCFRMYDLDGDGSISRSELLKIVESCLFQNALTLPPDALARIVDSTFQKADIDGDGRITEDEFQQYVAQHPAVIDQLTINSDAVVQARQHLAA